MAHDLPPALWEQVIGEIEATAERTAAPADANA
jgi:hypothetical protein